MPKRGFMEAYRILLSAYGQRGWWPLPSRALSPGFDGGGYHPGLGGFKPDPEDRFQICMGAILTQNTAWTNAERAVLALADAGLKRPEDLLAAPINALEALIRPSGYYRQKALRLKTLSAFLREGGHLQSGSPPSREGLLALNGVGPETADSILLYAFNSPVFVIDAYTLRLFSRLGALPEGTGYAAAQGAFMESLDADAGLFAEYHALIVEACKAACTKRSPACGICPLRTRCPSRGLS